MTTLDSALYEEESANYMPFSLSNYEHWAVLLFIVIDVFAFSIALTVCGLICWRTYTDWSAYLDVVTNANRDSREDLPQQRSA